MPAATMFAARSTKPIITVTIKYVMYANKSLILILSLTDPCSELNEFNFGESVWSIVKLHNTNLLVGVVYRSPNSDNTNNEKLLELLSRIRGKVNISNIFNYGRF